MRGGRRLRDDGGRSRGRGLRGGVEPPRGAARVAERHRAVRRGERECLTSTSRGLPAVHGQGAAREEDRSRIVRARRRRRRGAGVHGGVRGRGCRERSEGRLRRRRELLFKHCRRERRRGRRFRRPRVRHGCLISESGSSRRPRLTPGVVLGQVPESRLPGGRGDLRVGRGLFATQGTRGVGVLAVEPRRRRRPPRPQGLGRRRRGGLPGLPRQVRRRDPRTLGGARARPEARPPRRSPLRRNPQVPFKTARPRLGEAPPEAQGPPRAGRRARPPGRARPRQG
mmetsp:Transcript_28065/g.90463  ORF Transcript_28065/g.90463 Transcript_28065/m.90463 type:complete len:283 (-) Transcript_28065:813-1661(-)